MSDNERLEELRRRVARDPASIAFAHLAEEYRRCGRYDEAVETCQTGLAHHPSYLSARVTLSRALMELGRLDEAREELDIVLAAAPENLAAVRTASELQRRRGDASAAGAAVSPRALAAVRDQEELEQAVRVMARNLNAAPPPGAATHPPAGHDVHQRRVPAPDLFAMFGKALNADTDNFRDTAREEFFAGLAQDAAKPAAAPASPHPTLELGPAAPVAVADDQLADLPLHESDDGQAGWASVNFRLKAEATKTGPEATETFRLKAEATSQAEATRLAEAPRTDEVITPTVAASGFLTAEASAEAVSRKEEDEAKKLLAVLQQWLALLEASRPSTLLAPGSSTLR